MIAPKIERYSFGLIVIDGHIYTKDVIILPHRVISDWWRGSSHTLIPEDIQLIFDSSPDILIVGTGAYDRMQVSHEVIQQAEQKGIKLFVLPSGKAWQVYNTKKDEKKVAAAFHLTC